MSFATLCRTQLSVPSQTFADACADDAEAREESGTVARLLTPTFARRSVGLRLRIDAVCEMGIRGNHCRPEIAADPFASEEAAERNL